MRTGITLKIITVLLIVAAIMSATAFAAAGQPSSEESNGKGLGKSTIVKV